MAITTIVGVTIGVKDIDELDALLELCVQNNFALNSLVHKLQTCPKTP